MPLSRALLAVLAVVLAGPKARGSTSIPNGPALAARRAEWQQCTSFAPDEDTLVPPYSLSLLTPGLVDPRKEGSFARHTLLNRLPAVVNRLIADGRVDEGTASRLRALADEVPDTIPLPVPPAIFATDGGGLGVDGTFCERFNSEWERWTHERKEAKDWAHAMPLISLEIYFHRRVLDCTGYFGGGGESVTGGGNGCGVLQDPFQEMKSEALDAALSSDVWRHTLKDHMEQMQRVSADARLIEFWSGDDARRAAFLSALGSSSVPAFFDNISQTLTSALKASLWGNRGDLALAPEQADNTQEATKIPHTAHERGEGGGREREQDPHLLVNDAQAIVDHLLQTGDEHCGKGGRRGEGGERVVDIVLDNSGIELLCDLVLADTLLSFGLAARVRLHAKGEPLFLSDAMPKDISGHLSRMESAEEGAQQAFAGRVRAHLRRGTLLVCSHQFWTAPRLFWEMPVSLADDLAGSTLVIVKGDANYRRLIGDRQWESTIKLAQVVTPWFPSHLAALRTLKAEVAVGLPEGLAEQTAAVDANWMTSGKFGSIQFVPFREANTNDDDFRIK